MAHPIYIVDDDRSFGKSLKRLLTARGLKTDYYTSALSFLDSVPPSVHGWVVADIHMPDCDGFELIDRMNALHYDMHVIIITGRAQDSAAELASRKGAIALLQKPFTAEALLDLMNEVD